ncbi:MAG: hypothetical protein B6U88_00725 [Candidatus Aenigmarchaeota archaeon ex4484_56]|nr:MAG: hypothetical protein B6U88_00725 [Candidatus Aenigmarchaeota archaeon ex4484_56]
MEKKPLIGIIGGNGKMGCWFKNFFEKNDLKVIISDIETEYSNKEIAEMSDIIIISVPISKVTEVVKEIRNHIKKESLLTDTTSIKRYPLKEMKKAKCGVLGMHPLFGPICKDMKNKTIVFCRARDNIYVDFLKKLFRKNGANILEISPKEHDKQMAILQSLLHFTNISFSYFLYSKKFKSNPNFLTPSFKLQSLVLGRILAQNPELYADIEMENPYFRKISEEYIKEITKFQKIIKDKKYEEFKNKFNLSSSYFSEFIKIAEEKSTEILKLLEKQVIRVGKPKKINLKNAKVGFLGPEGTFSWIGAKTIFKNNVKLKPFINIRDIFKEVAEGGVDLGMVPIENSITGIVSETMYSFIDFPVKSIGSFKIPIHHVLASYEKDTKNIKIIKSHPQALLQCKKYLDENFPNILREPTSSTVAPILEDKNSSVGFIVPLLTAQKYKLNILRKNIEDYKNNFTRFFIISQSRIVIKNLKPKNTLILFAVYDKVGILRDILSIFADNKINLSALHSIPSRLHPWDYMFFLEVEKSYDSIKKIIKKLEKYCPYIRILGSA